MYSETQALSASRQVQRIERVLPALLALAYPYLIWSSATRAPVLVLAALLLPVVCGHLAYRLALTHRFPVGTGIGFFAIGSPALYSLLGGWLDFQKLLPFHANDAWWVIWAIAAVAAGIERPSSSIARPQSRPRLAFAHGISAALIMIFAAVHLTNHVAGIFGGEVHQAFMTTARHVYRQWFVEIPLVAAVVFQMLSGITLLVGRLRNGVRDSWAALQTASGLYMAMFFMSHVSAVARARYLRHTDTNWHWLTGDNLLTDPWSARLLPYYILGVLALGLHVACGIRWIALAHGKSARFATAAFAATFSALALVGAIIALALIRGSAH
jgi:succinate dehydrogenase/fumarate reductase cytochrome b subunit